MTGTTRLLTYNIGYGNYSDRLEPVTGIGDMVFDLIENFTMNMEYRRPEACDVKFPEMCEIRYPQVLLKMHIRNADDPVLDMLVPVAESTVKWRTLPNGTPSWQITESDRSHVLLWADLDEGCYSNFDEIAIRLHAYEHQEDYEKKLVLQTTGDMVTLNQRQFYLSECDAPGYFREIMEAGEL